MGNKVDAKFYLNENIAFKVAQLLRTYGITTVHTNEVKNQSKSDEFQLEYASAKNLILVTHNRSDFRYIHKQWIEKNKLHSGILLLAHGEPTYVVERIIRFQKEIYPKIELPFCCVPPNILLPSEFAN